MEATQPTLIPSPTHDDDDSVVSNSRDVRNVDRKAIAYLLRYETMVRQQEAEHMASLAHIRPLLDVFADDEMFGTTETMDADLKQEISYQQLKQALSEIEDSLSNCYIQTDRQLMMVLKTLTQKAADPNCANLTWAEFLQCYKTVISGMQTLQYVDSPLHRSRIKDRTLSMISLFEPPATQLLGNEGVPMDIGIPDSSFERPIMHGKTPKGQISLKKRSFFLLIVMFTMSAAIITATLMQWHQMKPDDIAPPKKLTPQRKRNKVNEALHRQSIFSQQSVVTMSSHRENKSTQPIKNKSTQPAKPSTPSKSYTIETPATSKTSPVVVEQPKKKTLPQPLPTPVFTTPSSNTVASSDPSQEEGVVKRIQQKTAMTFAAVGSVAGSIIVPTIMKSLPTIIGTQFVVAVPIAGMVAALAGLFFYV